MKSWLVHLINRCLGRYVEKPIQTRFIQVLMMRGRISKNSFNSTDHIEIYLPTREIIRAFGKDDYEIRVRGKESFLIRTSGKGIGAIQGQSYVPDKETQIKLTAYVNRCHAMLKDQRSNKWFKACSPNFK